MFADLSAWGRTIPSGTSLRSDGDDEIRDTKVRIGDAMEEEHFWDVANSGASGGIHRPGSSRLSFGAPPGSTGDEGRIFYDNAEDALVLLGLTPSSNTTLVSGGGGVGVKANQTSSQAIGTGYSFLAFQNEVFDTDGMFNVADSAISFRIPSDGVYIITLNILTADGQNERGIEAQILLNDVSTILAEGDIRSEGNESSLNITVIEELSSNDSIFARARRGNADFDTRTGRGATFLSIGRL